MSQVFIGTGLVIDCSTKSYGFALNGPTDLGRVAVWLIWEGRTLVNPLTDCKCLFMGGLFDMGY